MLPVKVVFSTYISVSNYHFVTRKGHIPIRKGQRPYQTLALLFCLLMCPNLGHINAMLLFEKIVSPICLFSTYFGPHRKAKIGDDWKQIVILCSLQKHLYYPAENCVLVSLSSVIMHKS